MESINPAQEAKVWQRVRGNPPEEQTLGKLLAMEAECRQICQYLQRNTHLRDSRGLARLREECGKFYHILLGMASVRGLDVTVSAPPAVRGNPEGLLRQSHATRQRAIALLEELPPEDRKLLKPKMEEHRLSILELLGQLPRK